MARTDRAILPENVKPTHYDISLFDIEFQAPWTYNGLVKIVLKVSKPTKTVVLNYKKLELQHASIQGDKQITTETTDISYDVDGQRATMSFSEEIQQGDATLAIKFTGTVNADMCGFYRSRYKADVEPAAATAKDSEGYHYMFSTQFEACDARQAFPCFDEPNVKATYDITLEVPEDQVAISNMPIKQSVHGSKPGTKKVSFDRTPPMSTYLAAWAVGDFDYVETFTKREYNGSPIPVRVYATKGLQDQGKFALDHAHQIIDLFSEVFGIDYPIPKADLLAVHDFALGAMENWGLVTYRAYDVLFDEQKSEVSRQNRIAYVVAHELAHQWFGNLVTMDWWDELWLNESFATFVGWYAVDRLHPEWNVWEQFISEESAVAFRDDSIRASHPVQVPVYDALDVDQIFDSISYNKGSAVLRMLTYFLGEEVFFKGVGMYLQKHAYGNATTKDLWGAMSHMSGNDVTSFIDPWIQKIGFPFLTVAEEPGQISIKQGRFLSTGDVKPEEDETIWSIPLHLDSGTATTGTQKPLATKEVTIRDVNDDFYLLNADQKAFYRTNYPPPRLAKLGKSLDKLGAGDKVGLVSDAYAMAFAGYGTTAGLLNLLEGFHKETNYMVWSAVSAALDRCAYIFAHDEKISNGLKKFTLQLVSPAVEKLGTQFTDGESYLTSMLRKLLLAKAAGAGHEGIIADLQERYQNWKSGDQQAFNPSIREVVFNTIVANGGEKEWEAMKQEDLTNSDIGTTVASLSALGKTRDAKLAYKYLEFVLSDDVKPQNMAYAVASIGTNNSTRDVLWQFTQEQWDNIYKKFGQTKIVFEKWFEFGFQQFAGEGLSGQMQAFLSNRDTRGIDRKCSIAVDFVAANTKYRSRDEKLVLAWLEAHGYA